MLSTFDGFCGKIIHLYDQMIGQPSGPSERFDGTSRLAEAFAIDQVEGEDREHPGTKRKYRFGSNMASVGSSGELARKSLESLAALRNEYDMRPPRYIDFDDPDGGS
jgi:hypothetical protein